MNSDDAVKLPSIERAKKKCYINMDLRMRRSVLTSNTYAGTISRAGFCPGRLGVGTLVAAFNASA